MTWTKSAIRAARKAELAPLLIHRGYRLQAIGSGNYRILPDQDDDTAPVGVIVKLNFWIWSEKNISGNAIDFFTRVEGKTFQQAMKIITAASDYDASEQNLRKELGNAAKTAR